MNNLLSATAKSLGAFVNLALVMCIVLYMFAVTGMQLFGDSYTVSVFGSQIPRWNFTDFGHSFMLIFRVVCGEWIEPLWDCMRASHSGAVLLFIPAFIMGNFVVSMDNRYLIYTRWRIPHCGQAEIEARSQALVVPTELTRSMIICVFCIAEMDQVDNKSSFMQLKSI